MACSLWVKEVEVVVVGGRRGEMSRGGGCCYGGGGGVMYGEEGVSMQCRWVGI